MKHLSLIIMALLISTSSQAQFGYGLTTGIDLYQVYRAPVQKDLDRDSRTTGSAVTNIILGPKIWIGGRKFSVSLEAPINWGMFALDLDEYKGLGAVAFPLGMKLNYGATSGFNDIQVFGISLGGGIQYMNTEIYYTDGAWDDLDGDYFSTIYGELGLGFGMLGADVQLVVRYGEGERGAGSFNIGLISNFNLRMFSNMDQVNRRNKKRIDQKKELKKSTL